MAQIQKTMTIQQAALLWNDPRGAFTSRDEQTMVNNL
jgi:hypothetical protein